MSSSAANQGDNQTPQRRPTLTVHQARSEPRHAQQAPSKHRRHPTLPTISTRHKNPQQMQPTAGEDRPRPSLHVIPTRHEEPQRTQMTAVEDRPRPTLNLISPSDDDTRQIQPAENQRRPTLTVISAGPNDAQDAQPESRRRQGATGRSHSSHVAAHVYGYHNIFHTHALPASDATRPPIYDAATSPAKRAYSIGTGSYPHPSKDQLPPYSCSVGRDAVLGVKYELSSPFRNAPNRKWQDLYIVLRGTQLCIHRTKVPGVLSRRCSEAEYTDQRNRKVFAGRLVKSYTLQHAEVGVALDFQKTELVPRGALGKLVHPTARQKAFESDPQLFEPVREFVLRLRVETEQILLCCRDQEEMLDWVEQLCAGIDISQPLDDRSEPRYRSLPRRNRRQRALEAIGTNEHGDLVPDERLLDEQERIIRSLYPHLATGQDPGAGSDSRLAEAAQEDRNENELRDASADPDSDDLDPADVLMPAQASHRRTSSTSILRPASPSRSASITPTASAEPAAPFDPKTAPPQDNSEATLLRYRRRCAPVLLFASPRAGDVAILHGMRIRIDARSAKLLPFAEHPPRYDSHDFPPDASAATTPAPSSPPLQLEHAATDSSTVAGSTGEESAESADSSSSDGADSPRGSGSVSSAVTPATPATTAPPSLLRGRSDDSIVFSPLDSELARTIARDIAEQGTWAEGPMFRTSRSRSDGDAVAAASKKGKGKEKEKTKAKAKGKGKAKDGSSAPSSSSKRFKLGKSTRDEETREMTRTLGSLGLLL